MMSKLDSLNKVVDETQIQGGSSNPLINFLVNTQGQNICIN